jgi:hypothetical protein
MTLFSIPLSLLKVNLIEMKYRIALKDEELKHATCAVYMVISNEKSVQQEKDTTNTTKTERRQST